MGQFTPHFGDFFCRNLIILGHFRSKNPNFKKCICNFLNAMYINDETEPVDYAIQAGRFSMFCVGHVLTFNHGMGTGSASIAFHECLKLLDYAGVKRCDVSLIRIGTCGGIGVNPGTICLTRSVLTETLEENFPFVECGKVKPMPMILDSDLGDKLAELATGLGVSSLVCKTLGTNDFYGLLV